MTTKDDVTRDYQRLFDAKEIVGKYWNALVGDGAGTVADADNPALTWVRYLTDQSKTSKVVNPLNLALVEDIPVIVGRRFPDTEYEEILAVDVSLYVRTMDEAAVEAYSHGRHGDDHNAAIGTDPASIDLRNIVEMRGRPRTVPDRTIFVEKGQYQFGNVIKRFPTGIIDLTASVPGGVGHRYVLVYVDGVTNLLGSADSIVVPIAATPPIPAVPANTISICIVDLEFGQTTITEDDIFDWRFLWQLTSFVAPAYVGTNAARLLLVLADLAELTRFYTTDTDKIWEVWEGAWRLVYPPAALSDSDGDAGTPWTTDAAGALTGTRNLILDDGASDSPILRFVGGSNNDRIDFHLLDDGVAGRSDLILQLADASAQSQFKIINTDAFTAVSIDSQGGAVFNEHSYDVDFRVEGNGDADLFFVDGGTDRIGIGTNAPTAKLEIFLADDNVRLFGAYPGFWLQESGVGELGALFVLDGALFQIQQRATAYGAHISTPFSMVMTAVDNSFAIQANEVVVNEGSADMDFRVESDGSANALFVQGSDGNIGMGAAAPGSLLELNMATEDLEFVDAGSVAATEHRWIECQVGGVTTYIRTFAAK